MTTDEIIERSLENGDMTVDLETGKVYGRKGPRGCILDEPVELGSVNHDGYLQIGLHADGRKRSVLAHRVVYMAAYGAIPDGMVIDHVNNDKTDNRIANLQLMTPVGNNRKAWHEGRHRLWTVPVEVRREIAREYAEGGCSQRQLAEKYGVSQTTVARVVEEFARFEDELAGVEWLDGDDVA